MTRPRQPAPPPLEGNDQLIAIVISAGWAVALVVLLLARDALPASNRWWIWTCVAGLAVGVFSLIYMPFLKRSRVRTAERRRLEREAR